MELTPCETFHVPRHCRDAWQTFHDAGWEECRLVMELDGVSTQSPVMFECSKRIQKENHPPMATSSVQG